jgi:hypothetical protein
MRDDKFWPRDIMEAQEKRSLVNEPITFRDTGEATVLHRFPRQPPLRAAIKDALAHVEVLLSRLETGVYCPQDVRAHYEKTVRELYLRSQDQVRVLRDALEFVELESGARTPRRLPLVIGVKHSH